MTTSPSPKLRILLADDHGVVREGVRSLIEAQEDLQVVGEAADGESALRLAEAFRPDLVVMDVSMPGLTGDLVAERMQAICPGAKVLALTVHEDREHLRRLMRAGASGYVLKLATGEELIRAIRVVGAGGVYIDPAIAAKVVDEMLDRHAESAPEGESSLTPRESEVLLRVAQGFSNKEIAAQLEISVKTVETHKLRSMDKLKLRGRADVVQYALRRGWLTPG